MLGWNFEWTQLWSVSVSHKFFLYFWSFYLFLAFLIFFVIFQISILYPVSQIISSFSNLNMKINLFTSFSHDVQRTTFPHFPALTPQFHQQNARLNTLMITVCLSIMLKYLLCASLIIVIYATLFIVSRKEVLLEREGDLN